MSGGGPGADRYGDIARSLDFLGFSGDALAVYLAVLDRIQDESELALSTGLSQERLGDALRTLEREGVLVRLVDQPVRFSAVPPREALARRVAAQEDRLAAARVAVRQLDELFKASPEETESPNSLIQVIRGPQAIARHHLAVLNEAQSEVRGCTKYHGPRVGAWGVQPTGRSHGSPVAVSQVADDEAEAEALDPLSALRRGVPHRWIWDQRIVELPGLLEGARECVAMGEQLRTIDELPGGITIADDKVAVLHLYPIDPQSPDMTTVVTRHPGLVGVIADLFEALWLRSSPFLGEVSSGEERGIKEDLVALLSAGIKDEAIARRLDVSPRTLARRIQELMSDLGVETRFQAGLKLGYEAGSGRTTPSSLRGSASS